MAGNNLLKFFRGTVNKRKNSDAILNEGQPFYENDTGRLYIGNGASTLKELEPIITNQLQNLLYDGIDTYNTGDSYIKVTDNSTIEAHARTSVLVTTNGTLNIVTGGTTDYSGGPVKIDTNGLGGLYVDSLSATDSIKCGSYSVITTNTITDYVPYDSVLTYNSENDSSYTGSILKFVVSMKGVTSVSVLYEKLGMNGFTSESSMYPVTGYYGTSGSNLYTLSAVYADTTGNLHFVGSNQTSTLSQSIPYSSLSTAGVSVKQITM